MLVPETPVAQPVRRKALDRIASRFGFGSIDLSALFYGGPLELPAFLNARRVPRKVRDDNPGSDADVQPVTGEDDREDHGSGLGLNDPHQYVSRVFGPSHMPDIGDVRLFL